MEGHENPLTFKIQKYIIIMYTLAKPAQNSFGGVSMTDENKKVGPPAEEALEEAELARENGQTVSRNSKHLIHCLSVVGQIEGHYVLAEQNKTTKYEHIIPALVAIIRILTNADVTAILSEGIITSCHSRY